MGCNGEKPDKCNGGEGSGLARFHGNRKQANACTPALRALLRVAARMFNRRMDEQADQQGLHTAVRLLQTASLVSHLSDLGFRGYGPGR